MTFDLPESPVPSVSSSTIFAIKDVTVVLNGKTFSTSDEILFAPASGNSEFLGDTEAYSATPSVISPPPVRSFQARLRTPFSARTC